MENADNLGLDTPYAVCRELMHLRADKSSAAQVEKDISELTLSQETLLLEAEKRVCRAIQHACLCDTMTLN